MLVESVVLRSVDMGASVLASEVSEHESWILSTVWRSSFCLASAVLIFNRCPALAVAAARRLYGSAVTHYLDDFKSLGLAHHRGAAQH